MSSLRNPTVMAERAYVEIVYCSLCRGVWLDRSELDKIIERSTTQQQPAHRQVQHHSPGYAMPGYNRQAHKNASKYKKRKSFLDDNFDF